MDVTIPLMAGTQPAAQQLKLFSNGKPARIASLTIDNSFSTCTISVYTAWSAVGSPIIILPGAYRTLSMDTQYLYITFTTPYQDGSIYIEFDDQPAQTAAANTQITLTNAQTTFSEELDGAATGAAQTLAFFTVPLGQILSAYFVKLRTSSLIQDGGYLQFYDSTAGRILWGIGVGSSTLNLPLPVPKEFITQNVIQVQLLLAQGMTYEALLEGTIG